MTNTIEDIRKYKESAQEEMHSSIQNILWRLQKSTGVTTWKIDVDTVEFQVLDQEYPTTVVSCVKIRTCI